MATQTLYFSDSVNQQFANTLQTGSDNPQQQPSFTVGVEHLAKVELSPTTILVLVLIALVMLIAIVSKRG